MINLIEEAILYATILHQGKVRKGKSTPSILHPLEVAQILSTMTDDQEIITAGILHEIVEDTNGTLDEIKSRFGERVALLVDAETEPAFPGEDRDKSWKKRKELSLLKLKGSEDIGARMLWLADQLANIRSLARNYSETGEAIWSHFRQKDPSLHCWYYRTVAEYVELDLNKTGAYKELIKHINYLWPGTFDSEKTKYRKYKEVSVEGCKLLGSGLKGDVYRYDEELIIKVYNRNNTYKDVEREIALSRRAFVLGVPTAISFGIVSVRDRYGAMYELVDADTLSTCIARNPKGIGFYAQTMAAMAKQIHAISAQEDDHFPDAKDRVRDYITHGIAKSDPALAERCLRLVNALPETHHLLHGDFHTSNVFLQGSDPLLIDMDRLSVGDAIIELGDFHLYYMTYQDKDPEDINPYFGISYRLGRQFFRLFMEAYLETSKEEIIQRVTDKARFLSNLRLMNRLWKKGYLSTGAQLEMEGLLRDTEDLVSRITDLRL